MNLEVLISTIVTSTAALIAIIGGFLVSRVITLSSDQNGINRKLNELDNEINANKSVLSDINEYILEEDAFDFISDNVEVLSKNTKTIEKIHKEDKYTKLTIEQLEPFIKKYQSILNEIQRLTIETHIIPEDFNEFKNSLTVELSFPENFDWYEMTYDFVYESQLKRKKNRYYLPKAFITPNVQPINRYYHEQVKRKEQIESNLTILELQKKAQGKILKEYIKPSNVWWGLVVLVYSSMVGIAFPVTLLPYPLDTYNDSLTKVVLIIMFLSELVALFGYLAFSMRKLVKRSD